MCVERKDLYSVCMSRVLVAQWLGRRTFDRGFDSRPGRNQPQESGHPDQLSLRSFRGRYQQYQPYWLELRRTELAYVGLQVKLFDT